jgi:hypothetical protein
MANETFDRETILDLVVNIIPLFIILFFIVAFLLYNPFGVEPLASALQFGLLLVPFVLLAILTYISGKAIADAERGTPVYIPGQATVTGAKPLHEAKDADSESDSGPELEAGSDDRSESRGGA